MSIETSAWKALLCVLAGLALHAAGMLRAVGRERRDIRLCLALLLPAACGFLLAKAGYEILQAHETMASFRWCFTAGLLGMLLGMYFAARLTAVKPLVLMDRTAPELCLAAGLARLSQRWLGDAGIGFYVENEALISRTFLVFVNEWQEHLLAVFWPEAMLAAAACIRAALSRKRTPDGAGITLALALAWLMIPSVLLEQFRMGQVMRWRMLRLEQVLYGMVAVFVLFRLCMACRRGGAPSFRAYLPAGVFLLMAAGIAVIQFTLDGKLFPVRQPVAWTLYVLALIVMLAAEEYAAARLRRDRRPYPKGE